nr:calmodulin-like protein [Pomacea canaliculata]
MVCMCMCMRERKRCMCVGVMCVRVYIHALVNCTCHTAYPRHTNGQKAHVLEGRRLLTTNLGHYRENQTLSWRVATQEVFFAVKYFSLRVIKTITTMTMMKLATGMIFFKADETDDGNDGFEDDIL